MPTYDDICILTAADAGFFDGLRLLARGLREVHPRLPLCCADLGLTDAQRLRTWWSKLLVWTTWTST